MRHTAAGRHGLPVLVTLPSRFSSAAMRWSESPCPASRATFGAARSRNAAAARVRSDDDDDSRQKFTQVRGST